MVWCSHLFQNFPQFVVIHTVKGFGIVNKAEIDVFWGLSCFFYDQRMLTIWSLVPLPFLNPVWTSGSSHFTYCWSLARGILSITLLACKTNTIVQQLEHSLALPFFGIGMKIDLFCSVATAEFSKYAGILSAPRSQHRLLGFDITQLEFHHLC